MPAEVLVLEKTWEKGEEKREASQTVLPGTLGDGSRAAGCGAGTAWVGWQPQLREPTRVCGLMPRVEGRAQSCTACAGKRDGSGMSPHRGAKRQEQVGRSKVAVERGDGALHAAEGRKSKKRKGVHCTVTETTLGLLPGRLGHAAALGLLVRVCGKVWQSECLGEKTFSGHPTPPLQQRDIK